MPTTPKGRKTRARKTSTDRRLTAADKQVRAMQLRMAGASYDEIAAAPADPGDPDGPRLYADKSGARKAVQAALDATLREPADELRAMELDRLDRAQRAIWTRVIQGDLQAVDRLIRIMDRRARYTGLDQGGDLGSVGQLADLVGALGQLRDQYQADVDEVEGAAV